MTPSLEGWPIKATEAPSPDEVGLALLDTNPVFQSHREEWLKNVNKFDVMSVSEKSPVGYRLEVDVQYPDELHKLQNTSSRKTCCFW